MIAMNHIRGKVSLLVFCMAPPLVWLFLLGNAGLGALFIRSAIRRISRL
jgi:hypothetical protein